MTFVVLWVSFFLSSMRPKAKCVICNHFIRTKGNELTINCIRDQAVYQSLLERDNAKLLRVHSACAQSPHKHGWMEVGDIDTNHHGHRYCDTIICSSCCNSLVLLYACRLKSSIMFFVHMLAPEPTWNPCRCCFSSIQWWWGRNGWQ